MAMAPDVAHAETRGRSVVFVPERSSPRPPSLCGEHCAAVLASGHCPYLTLTTEPLMSADLNLADYIRSIPDFPKPGILFRDITPLLANPAAFRRAVVDMANPFRSDKIDVVAAAEARGFIFAAPVALELNAALVPIRKPGKLPFKTQSFSYDLEYGSDTLEIHADAIAPAPRCWWSTICWPPAARSRRVAGW